jgi:hypothetical protein
MVVTVRSWDNTIYNAYNNVCSARLSPPENTWLRLVFVNGGCNVINITNIYEISLKPEHENEIAEIA